MPQTECFQSAAAPARADRHDRHVRIWHCPISGRPPSDGLGGKASAYTNGALRFPQETAAIPASVPQIRGRATGLILPHSDWKY